MGPLIANGIISPEWNSVIAILIGIAFGFVLEASGFSSSRVIVGVFYGYDFTVLRVFMTATAVAMVGLIYFSFMGWINLSQIFILPTFVTPAIVGGLIMGFGFIMGGFCPGTSFTGIAIGKLDALVYTIGIYIGIFIFSIIFPWVKGIYFGGSMGISKISDVLGLPDGVFVFLFVLATIGAFVMAFWYQKKFKKHVEI